MGPGGGGGPGERRGHSEAGAVRPALLVLPALSSQLLDPKFPFWVSGQTVCCPTYLPGNGGLLLAIAMMAAGSDSSAPGYFPAGWGVTTEGFNMPYP